MTEQLTEKLEAVVDRESFLVFVKALIADREDEVKKEKVNPSSPWGASANGWENGTIERYLDAAVAWAEDSRGQPLGLPIEPSWKAFATFLYCGKIYE
jgi:predicted Ser/Thr protein kinase